MKACVPVHAYCGLESRVYGHFGSAPCIVLVDTDTLAVERLGNADREHAHGSCNPLRTLGQAARDAVLVGGIGRRALAGLREAGIAVYRAETGTVAEAVSRFREGKRPQMDPDASCRAHGGAADCHCSR